jgi:hypothetical protein
MSISPTFTQEALTWPINEAVVALGMLQDDVFYASGTGVIVAPRVALTARHVVEDYFAIHTSGRRPPRSGTHDVSYEIIAASALGAWRVVELWPSTVTDIAALHLSPLFEHERNYVRLLPQLNATPPAVGSRVIAFGYHRSEARLSDGHLRWTNAHATSVAEVREVHVGFRDLSRLNFPCFRTNQRFEGGMSGGPVMDQNGLLCGLVCSSLPPVVENDEYTSYVASLWPAFGIPVDLDRSGDDRWYALFDLLRPNTTNADRVKVKVGPDGRRPEVSLRTRPYWWRRLLSVYRIPGWAKNRRRRA